MDTGYVYIRRYIGTWGKNTRCARAALFSFDTSLFLHHDHHNAGDIDRHLEHHDDGGGSRMLVPQGLEPQNQLQQEGCKEASSSS